MDPAHTAAIRAGDIAFVRIPNITVLLRAVKAWVRNCKYGVRSQRTFGLRGKPHPHEYLH